MPNPITYSFRRLRTALATVAISLPLVMAASIVHTETLSESDLDIWSVAAPNGDMLTRVSGSGMQGGGEVGSPEIPCKVIRFLVPANAADFSVEIEELSETCRIEFANPLFPVQAAIPINDYSDDKFVYPDFEAYGRPSASFRAEVLEESVLEGRYHIVSVGLWPLAYTGNPNSLDLCGKMRVRLDFKETDTPSFKAPRQAGPTYVDIAGLLVNPEDAPADSSKLAAYGFTPMGQFIGHYYIISERSLLPALEDLAVWKTQKGYRVQTVAIEDIYEDSRYRVGTNGIVDEAESLRRYLQDEFNAFGTFFCLLVGDHKTRMPIRKVRGGNSSFNQDGYVPTDNYFSDLMSGSWWVRYDDDSDHYIGGCLKNYQPCIYVGRLMCHTEKSISDYISKLILYETNPGRGNSEYLNRSALFVQRDQVMSHNDIITKMEDLFPQAECFIDSKYYDADGPSSPTSATMLNKLNDTGYCSLFGHGEPSTVACSGRKSCGNEWEYVKALDAYRAYDKDNPEEGHQTMITNKVKHNGLDLLNNLDSPGVVYSSSCTSAPFDVYDSGSLIYDIPETMASSYTTGGRYGGVAYLGNTRDGYSSRSKQLETNFLDAVGKSCKIGVAESLSKFNYVTTDPLFVNFDSHVLITHNLIGDPEIDFWKSSPEELDVAVSWNDNQISLTGVDAEGCYAVINDGEGGLIIPPSPTNPLYGVEYINGGKMNSVGVYKSGFLPIVKINCYKDVVTECHKKFLVRSAHIGMDLNSSVMISTNGTVDIRAVDEIDCGPDLCISEDGLLTLKCDKQVRIEGSSIVGGGHLSVDAQSVTLYGGFSVEAGSILNINSIKSN